MAVLHILIRRGVLLHFINHFSTIGAETDELAVGLVLNLKRREYLKLVDFLASHQMLGKN